jgi:hypothetical protein
MSISLGAIWGFSKAAWLPWVVIGAQRARNLRARCIGALGPQTHVHLSIYCSFTTTVTRTHLNVTYYKHRPSCFSTILYSLVPGNYLQSSYCPNFLNKKYESSLNFCPTLSRPGAPTTFPPVIGRTKKTGLPSLLVITVQSKHNL